MLNTVLTPDGAILHVANKCMDPGHLWKAVALFSVSWDIGALGYWKDARPGAIYGWNCSMTLSSNEWAGGQGATGTRISDLHRQLSNKKS